MSRSKIAIISLSVFVSALAIRVLCDNGIDVLGNLVKHGKDYTFHSKVHSSDHTGDHHVSMEDHNQQDANEACCDELGSQLSQAIFHKGYEGAVSQHQLFLYRLSKYQSIITWPISDIKLCLKKIEHPPPLSGFFLRKVLESFLN